MKHLQVDVAGDAMNLLNGVDLASDAVDEYQKPIHYCMGMSSLRSEARSVTVVEGGRTVEVGEGEDGGLFSS